MGCCNFGGGGVENFEKYKRAAGENFEKYKRAAGEFFEKYKRAAGEKIENYKRAAGENTNLGGWKLRLPQAPQHNCKIYTTRAREARVFFFHTIVLGLKKGVKKEEKNTYRLFARFRRNFQDPYWIICGGCFFYKTFRIKTFLLEMFCIFL